MANTVSFIIKGIDRFSSVGDKIAAVTDRVKSKFKQATFSAKKFRQGIDSVKSSAVAAVAKLKKLSKKVGKVGKKMKDFGKDMLTSVTLPLAALGAVALRQSAKMESLRVSFETMLGSAEKAKQLTEDLTKFTATTPFQLQGVANSTKALLAFGVTQKEMIPTLRQLGDIASGSGKPLEDIALIFGKAKAKGKLMTEEINQLSEKGIPIIDDLAKSLGVSKSQIFKLASESKLSFSVMENSFRRMTSEGGIFFQQTQKQSETLSGLFSTLVDNALLIAQAIGDVIVEVFGLKGGMKGLIAQMTELPKKIRAFAKENPNLTRFLVILTAIVAIAAPLIIALGAIAVILPIIAIGIGLLFSPITLIIIAVGLLIGLFIALKTNLGGITDSITRTFIKWVGVVSGFINNIIEKINAFKATISALISSVTGGVLGNALSTVINFGGEVESNNNNRTQLDVNLNAPKGTIKNVQSKTTGNTKNFNTGLNVVTSPAGA